METLASLYHMDRPNARKKDVARLCKQRREKGRFGARRKRLPAARRTEGLKGSAGFLPAVRM